MSRLINKNFFNKHVYVNFTVLDVQDIKNLTRTWIATVQGYLQKIGILPTPPTPEELIGDARPAEILHAWGEAVKAKGKDIQTEFQELFSYRGSLFAQSRMTQQVKWFQNWRERQEQWTKSQMPVSMPLVQNILTPERVAMQKIGTTFVNGIYALPREIRREVANGVLAELAEKFKD